MIIDVIDYPCHYSNLYVSVKGKGFFSKLTTGTVPNHAGICEND